MTVKLSESQSTVLAAACHRDDRCVFPVTNKLKGNAAGNVLKSLLAKGLIEEVRATADDNAWRHHEESGIPLTLQATESAYAALGIEATGEGRPAEAPTLRTRAPRARKGVEGRKASRQRAVLPAGDAKKGSRAGTKQADLIAMLRRSEGASINEIMAKTGWQAHTVRGAIAGALKKKLGLDVTSEKVGDRGRVYRIAG